MFTHTITCYNWPITLLKDIEKATRSFNWTGAIKRRKLVMVAWKKMGIPQSHGGLGLRSLMNLNTASNLELGWNFLTSKEPWAIILKGMVLKSHGRIKYHIFYSLWSNIKTEWLTISSKIN